MAFSKDFSIPSFKAKCRQAALSVLALFFCSFKTFCAPESLPISDDKMRSLLAKAARGCDAALVVGITDGANHRIYASGFLDRHKRIRADSRTLFEIGSITKVFTGILLAQLKQEGLLSYDDELRKYLGGRLSIELDSSKITLLQLATHSSGLPRQANSGSDDKVQSRAKLDGFLSKGSLEFKPGSNYAYSNLGYNLLGVVLEKVSGSPFDRLFSRRLAEPIRLENTRFFLDKERLERLAASYDQKGRQLKPSLQSASASGGLKSSADDLLHFLDLCLSGKSDSAAAKVSAALKESCRVCVACPDKQYACLGWFSDSAKSRYGKSGQIDGFNCRIEFFPGKKLGLVALSATSQIDTNKLLNELHKELHN